MCLSKTRARAATHDRGGPVFRHGYLENTIRAIARQWKPGHLLVNTGVPKKMGSDYRWATFSAGHEQIGDVRRAIDQEAAEGRVQQPQHSSVQCSIRLGACEIQS